MTEDGDQLLAQLGRGLLVEQGGCTCDCLRSLSSCWATSSAKRVNIDCTRGSDTFAGCGSMAQRLPK